MPTVVNINCLGENKHLYAISLNSRVCGPTGMPFYARAPTCRMLLIHCQRPKRTNGFIPVLLTANVRGVFVVLSQVNKKSWMKIGLVNSWEKKVAMWVRMWFEM